MTTRQLQQIDRVLATGVSALREVLKRSEEELERRQSAIAARLGAADAEVLETAAAIDSIQQVLADSVLTNGCTRLRELQRELQDVLLDNSNNSNNFERRGIRQKGRGHQRQLENAAVGCLAWLGPGGRQEAGPLRVMYFLAHGRPCAALRALRLLESPPNSVAGVDAPPAPVTLASSIERDKTKQVAARLTRSVLARQATMFSDAIVVPRVSPLPFPCDCPSCVERLQKWNPPGPAAAKEALASLLLHQQLMGRGETAVPRGDEKAHDTTAADLFSLHPWLESVTTAVAANLKRMKSLPSGPTPVVADVCKLWEGVGGSSLLAEEPSSSSGEGEVTAIMDVGYATAAMVRAVQAVVCLLDQAGDEEQLKSLLQNALSTYPLPEDDVPMKEAVTTASTVGAIDAETLARLKSENLTDLLEQLRLQVRQLLAARLHTHGSIAVAWRVAVAVCAAQHLQDVQWPLSRARVNSSAITTNPAAGVAEGPAFGVAPPEVVASLLTELPHRSFVLERNAASRPAAAAFADAFESLPLPPTSLLDLEKQLRACLVPCEVAATSSCSWNHLLTDEGNAGSSTSLPPPLTPESEMASRAAAALLRRFRPARATQQLCQRLNDWTAQVVSATVAADLGLPALGCGTNSGAAVDVARGELEQHAAVLTTMVVQQETGAGDAAAPSFYTWIARGTDGSTATALHKLVKHGATLLWQIWALRRLRVAPLARRLLQVRRPTTAQQPVAAGAPVPPSAETVEPDATLLIVIHGALSSLPQADKALRRVGMLPASGGGVETPLVATKLCHQACASAAAGVIAAMYLEAFRPRKAVVHRTPIIYQALLDLAFAKLLLEQGKTLPVTTGKPDCPLAPALPSGLRDLLAPPDATELPTLGAVFGKIREQLGVVESAYVTEERTSVVAAAALAPQRLLLNVSGPAVLCGVKPVAVPVPLVPTAKRLAEVSYASAPLAAQQQQQQQLQRRGASDAAAQKAPAGSRVGLLAAAEISRNVSNISVFLRGRVEGLQSRVAGAMSSKK